MNTSIHPSAIQWKKAMPNNSGPVTGSESRIGHVWMAIDGWYCAVSGESLGPFKSERKAQKAAERFVKSGYSDRSEKRSAA